MSAPRRSKNGPLRVGIGGPVGSGKTTLVEKLCKAMRDRWSIAVVTNDIYTQEDALILTRLQALPEDRILGWRRAQVAHLPPRALASAQLLPKVGHDGAFDVRMDWGDPIPSPAETDSGGVGAGYVTLTALSRLVDDTGIDLTHLADG